MQINNPDLLIFAKSVFLNHTAPPIQQFKNLAAKKGAL